MYNNINEGNEKVTNWNVIIKLLDSLRSKRYISASDFEFVINNPSLCSYLSDALPNWKEIEKGLENIIKKSRRVLRLMEIVGQLTSIVMSFTIISILYFYFFLHIPWGEGPILWVSIFCITYLLISIIIRFWGEKSRITPQINEIFKSFPSLEQQIVKIINDLFIKVDRIILDNDMRPESFGLELSNDDYMGINVVLKPGWFASTKYKVNPNPLYLAFMKNSKWVKIIFPHTERSFFRDMRDLKIQGKVMIITTEIALKKALLKPIISRTILDSSSQIQVRSTKLKDIPNLTIINDHGVWEKQVSRKGVLLKYAYTFIEDSSEQSIYKTNFQILWSESKSTNLS